MYRSLAKKIILWIALIGLADTAYLTYHRLLGSVPACYLSPVPLVNCDPVLTSSFAVFLGIPLAVYGFVYYLLVFSLALASFKINHHRLDLALFVLTGAGLAVSLFLLYLQLFVIGSVCLFCTLSGLTNLALFCLSLWLFMMKLLPDGS